MNDSAKKKVLGTVFAVEASFVDGLMRVTNHGEPAECLPIRNVSGGTLLRLPRTSYQLQTGQSYTLSQPYTGSVRLTVRHLGTCDGGPCIGHQLVVELPANN